MKIFSFFLGQWPSSTKIYFVTDEVFTKSGDDFSSPQTSRKQTASPSLSPRKKSTADRPSSEQLTQYAGPIDIKNIKRDGESVSWCLDECRCCGEGN